MTTRAEARERGEKEYFTGEPCKHGHVAPRRTDSGACKACAAPMKTAQPDAARPPPPMLMEVGLWVMERDYVNLRTIVWDSVRARHPHVTQGHVFGRSSVKAHGGGVMFIKPHVDPMDMEMLREIKDALWTASAPFRNTARAPADEMRAQAMRKQLEEQAENHRFQPDEWKFT